MVRARLHCDSHEHIYLHSRNTHFHISHVAISTFSSANVIMQLYGWRALGEVDEEISSFFMMLTAFGLRPRLFSNREKDDKSCLYAFFLVSFGVFFKLLSVEIYRLDLLFFFF